MDHDKAKSPCQQNFSWVVPGTIAGCSLPGNYPATLKEDLDFLKEAGIKAIISLNEASLDSKATESEGLHHLVLSVKDYEPPTIEQMEKMVEFVDTHEGTVIHCNAGMGRTGTMLAAYLIAKGTPSGDAIKKLRKERRGSIQTNKQEDGLRRYEAYLKEKQAKT